MRCIACIDAAVAIGAAWQGRSTTPSEQAHWHAATRCVPGTTSPWPLCREPVLPRPLTVGASTLTLAVEQEVSAAVMQDPAADDARPDTRDDAGQPLSADVRHMRYWVGATMWWFHWIAATVAGVCFGSLFSLAFPDETEQLGWMSLYACVATLMWPAVAFWLVQAADRDESTTTGAAAIVAKRNAAAQGPMNPSQWTVYSSGGTAVLLIAACAEGDSGSHSEWISEVTSELGLDTSEDVATLAGSMGLTVLVTLLVIALQVVVDPLAKRWPSRSYRGIFFRVLQTSFWSTVGYSWNTLWYEIAVYFASGTPSAAQNFGRAGITILVSLPVVRFLLPLQAPESWGIWRSKSHITVRMAICVNVAYAVADAFWGFCTHEVEEASSEVGGWAAALGFALLMSFATMLVARCTKGGWTPESGWMRWVLLTMSWAASTTMYYPFAALLEVAEGFGLTVNGDASQCPGGSGSGSGSGSGGSGGGGGGTPGGGNDHGGSGGGGGGGHGGSSAGGPPLQAAGEHAVALLRHLAAAVVGDGNGDVGDTDGGHQGTSGPPGGLGPPGGGSFSPPDLVSCDNKGLSYGVAACIRVAFSMLMGLLVAFLLSRGFRAALRSLHAMLARARARHGARPGLDVALLSAVDESLEEDGGSDAGDIAELMSKVAVAKMLTQGPNMLTAPLWADTGRRSVADQQHLWQDDGGAGSGTSRGINGNPSRGQVVL